MAESEILWSDAGGIGELTINRPASRNGVTRDLLLEFHSTLRAVAARQDLAVVIVRGAGNDFSVGADIKASIGQSQPPVRYEDLSEAYHVSTLLHRMPQVTIAAIDGACAGAGLGWATACDMRFASTRAVFNTAFLKVGASGDMGIAWFLSRIVGAARARELMFLPGKFGAQEALGLGLVTRLFEPERLHAEVREIAGRLAESPPAALRLMKANMVSAETLPLDQFIEIETARLLHIASGLQEGFQRFLDERKGSDNEAAKP